MEREGINLKVSSLGSTACCMCLFSFAVIIRCLLLIERKSIELGLIFEVEVELIVRVDLRVLTLIGVLVITKI